MKRLFLFMLSCLFLSTTAMGCAGNAPLPKPTNKAIASATPTEKKSTSAGKGSSWTAFASGASSGEIYNIGYSATDHGIIVGPNGYVDLINTKAMVSIPKDSIVDYYGVAYGSASVVYVCGDHGQVLKSTNGGVIFSQVGKFGDSKPNQCQLLSFCDEDNGMIASKKRMAITKDGAKKWAEVTVPSDILAVYMLSPNEFYYVDTDLNLQKTVDAGKTWEKTSMEFSQKENTIKEIGMITLHVEKENTFNIFCVQNLNGKFKKLASYSTSDNWASYMVNLVPDTPKIGRICTNHTGDILSVINNSFWNDLVKNDDDSVSK